jgi:hypothetical protein
MQEPGHTFPTGLAIAIVLGCNVASFVFVSAGLGSAVNPSGSHNPRDAVVGVLAVSEITVLAAVALCIFIMYRGRHTLRYTLSRK